MLKNKKAIITETIIFIILVIVFTAMVMLFVSRLGSGATLYEQIYAKQIGLIIDSAKPGTNVTLFVPELYSLAERNRVSEIDIFSITSDNKIIVKISDGKGYEYQCFSKLKPGMIGFDKEKNTITIMV